MISILPCCILFVKLNCWHASWHAAPLHTPTLPLTDTDIPPHPPAARKLLVPAAAAGTHRGAKLAHDNDCTALGVVEQDGHAGV